MSRRTERAILGSIGFLAAVIALFVGVRLMSGESVDVAASSVGGDGAVASGPSAGSDGAGGSSDGAAGGSGDGEDGAPGSLVITSTTSALVSTTAATPSSETTTSSTSSESSTSTSATTATTDGETTTVPSSSSSTSSMSAPDDTVTTVGSSSTTQTQVSTSTTVVSAGLSAIEREIVRLTNELRTNPAGPHRRQAPMPECLDDDDSIVVDSGTGHPLPVSALTLSEPVSIRMSRDWSQQMADADQMSHRSGESQNAIYAELGIDWAVRSENVAWAVGYDLSDVALLFFRGWRESGGHYCNMMSGSITKIGVGHVRTNGGKDFATQNFYRSR